MRQGKMMTMVEPIAPATASAYGWMRLLMPRINRCSKPGSMVTRGRKMIDYIQQHTHRHSLLITWLLPFFMHASSFALHATTAIAMTNMHNRHISGVKLSRVLNARRVWDHGKHASEKPIDPNLPHSPCHNCNRHDQHAQQTHLGGEAESSAKCKKSVGSRQAYV